MLIFGFFGKKQMRFDSLVVRVALKLAEINVFEVTSKLDTFAPPPHVPNTRQITQRGKDCEKQALKVKKHFELFCELW